MHGRTRVGAIEVTVLCEGWAPLELSDECPGQDVDWDAERERFPWMFADDATWRWHVHPIRLDTPSGVVIVDTGVGSFGPIVPWAEGPNGDAWDGLDRGSVRHVVLTHLHADHAGGAVHDDGAPRFPNATYHVHPADWEHFGAATSHRYNARTAMEGLAAQGVVDLTREDHDVAPGIRVIHSPGHTPGHRSVVVADRDAAVLLSGDLLHVPIQAEHPEWPSNHDVDPAAACRSRVELLGRAATRAWLVGVPHFARPFGRVGAGGPGWTSIGDGG
jgi:glyoxylase-like metal-dependent hydrolase (beta-lactamase superfamily II)